MRCLRCPAVDLVEQRGALLEAVCPSCQGRLLDATASARLLEDHCGLERALVGELCAHYRGRLRCPACTRHLSAVPIGAVTVDLCGGCGALFLDRGELRRLSRDAVGEIEVAAPTPEHPPPGPEPPPVSSVSSVSSASAPPSPNRTGARPAGRDAAVFLRDPPAADAALPLLLDVWQRAAFRTAVDARAMVGRAVGGVFADDCSAEEGARLAAILASLGHSAGVVTDGELLPPAPFRQKEIGILPGAITVQDGLGRHSRELPAAGITVLAAGKSRVVTSEKVSGRPPPSGGMLRQATRALTPRALVRAMDSVETSNRMPSTAMVEVEQLFLDIVVGEERYRLDGAGFVGRSDGPRTLQALAIQLQALAPDAVRQRGFVALVDGGSPPTFRALRELDREVTWSMWRRRTG